MQVTIRVADESERGEKKTGKDETEETRLRVITTTIWKFKFTVLNSFKQKLNRFLLSLKKSTRLLQGGSISEHQTVWAEACQGELEKLIFSIWAPYVRFWSLHF